jgi:hypothetical protein
MALVWRPATVTRNSSFSGTAQEVVAEVSFILYGTRYGITE